MNISYEMNPPKIITNTSFDLDSVKNDMQRFHNRVSKLIGLVDNVHLTDSVLGIPRISSISAAQEVIKLHPNLQLRCSLRVRDRNLGAIMQLVSDAVLLGIEGLLILKGDAPQTPAVDSSLKPSEVVRILNEYGFDKKIKLFLSVPSNPDLNKIRKKVEADPFGFVTQSIDSLDHLRKITDHAKSNNIRVTPTIMVPSPKNKSSAELIKLDWKEYENDAYSFIRRASDMCGEVLITSPNSFNEGMDLLNRVKGVKN